MPPPSPALTLRQITTPTIATSPSAAPRATSTRLPHRHCHESKFGEALGPRGQIVVRPADAAPRMRVVACSPLTHRLAEPMERHEVDFVTPTGRAPIDGNDRDATVWLIGTSFAAANGAAAPELQLGRPIRWTIRFGASGLASLRAALPELRIKTRAKVVVWVIVERRYFSDEWAAPAPLPRPEDGG